MKTYSVYERLLALDGLLASKKFPPLTEWWKETFRLFYDANRRQLVLRVGRRGGKSSSLCRWAVAEALWGDHKIPPGDTGRVSIVSVDKVEAKERLTTIAAILDAAGFKGRYRKTEFVITMSRPDGQPIAFEVFTASIGGVSGRTSIACICDEVAKWQDRDSGANPAKEVLHSLRPSMISQPNAKIVLASSPWSTLDAHHEAVLAGDDDYQVVRKAATWEARPDLSEATCKLEAKNDQRVFLREYAAIPQGAALGAFDADAINNAFTVLSGPRKAARRVMIIDASSGKSDAFTWGAFGVDLEAAEDVFRDTDGKPLLFGETGHTVPLPRDPKAPPPLPPIYRFDYVRGEHGRFWDQDADGIVKRIAKDAKASGITRVYGDQRDEFTLRSMFKRHGLKYESVAWSSRSKEDAVGLIRQWFAADELALPDHKGLREELFAFEEHATPTGGLSFKGRGRTHDDYVALVMTAAMVAEGKKGPKKGSRIALLPSDPHAPKVKRGMTMRRILPF